MRYYMQDQAGNVTEITETAYKSLKQFSKLKTWTEDKPTKSQHKERKIVIDTTEPKPENVETAEVQISDSNNIVTLD